jgi:hypothetical protein
LSRVIELDRRLAAPQAPSSPLRPAPSIIIASLVC